MKVNNIPELLSPAGSLESLYAAVNNGCNAVYFGGKNFSARSYANNFTIEEIKQAVYYCKLRSVKTYITLNTLIKEKEFKELDEYLKEIFSAGIDAVIVQDFGVANFIKKYYENIPIHASTQMTIHNVEGVKFLKNLGFERIVLSRELSLKEIKNIITNVDVEIECFIHGALCYSYSGQCLMSSFIGGRSGNRGKCAQPCRLPYRLLNNNENISIHKDKYLLSLKDVQTLNILPDLISAGIHSFKIEGRMKRPEYTAGATKIYRKYIDKYLYDPNNYSVDEKDLDILKQLFNRGEFSSGYYFNKNNMLYVKSPKNSGLKIGEVLSYDSKNKICKLKINRNLNAGDGIEILTKRQPHPGTAIKKSYIKDSIVKCKIDGIIQKGDKVYRTKDIKLLASLNKEYKTNKKKKDINAYIKMEVGNNAYLKLYDNNMSVESNGAVVEESQNNPLDKDKIIKQICKTGNTVFNIKKIDYKIGENIFIPISKINELRRNAIEKLEQKIINNNSYNIIDVINKDSFKIELIQKKYLNVLVSNMNQFYVILDTVVKRIYLELNNFSIDEIEKCIRYCKDKRIELYIALPYVFRKNTESYLKEVLMLIQNLDIDGFLVRTYGQYNILKKSNKKFVLDYTFNTFNNNAIKAWKRLEADELTVSLELNIKEIKDLCYNNSLEIIVYGYLPVMISSQCVIKNNTDENKYCFKHTDEKFSLKDRMNNEFIIQRDCQSCYNIIYNSKKLFLVKYITDLKKLPTKNYRLHFLNEDSKEVENIISIYNNLVGSSNKDIEFKYLTDFTKGHYFKGVE